MHALDGPRAKVERTKNQIATLQIGFDRFFKRYPYRVVVAEFDKRPGHYNLRVQSGPSTFPDEWGVLIGEIAHNIRSALDGLVCQLAIIGKPGRDWRFCEDPKTGFPISLKGAYSRQKNRFPRKKLWYLKKVHAARIEALQPYKRGNGYRRSPLWLLSELNNADKHRLITVVTVVAAGIGLQGLWGGGGKLKVGVPLHLNAKVADVAPLPTEGVRVLDVDSGSIWTEAGKIRTKMQHEVQVNTDITPSVCFGDSCDAVNGLPVIRTLQRMKDEVSRIVESFAEEFA